MVATSRIKNEPAGRLHGILSQIDGNPRPISAWWEYVCSEVAPDGDPVTLRAEAAALLRDVERAVQSLSPAEHSHSDLLRDRDEWAKPIFGLGLHDSPSVSHHPHGLINPSALSSLSMLSSVLIYAAPEEAPKGSDEQLSAVLEEVASTLEALLKDVETASDLPEVARSRIRIQLVSARDAITYIRTRGYAYLLGATTTANYTVATVRSEIEDNVQGKSRESITTKLDTWAGQLSSLVSKVKSIVVPPVVGVIIGVHTQDIASGFFAAYAASTTLNSAEMMKLIGSIQAPRQLEPPPQSGASETDM